MSRSVFSPIIRACSAALLSASTAFAVIPEFTWAPDGSSSYYFDNDNWLGGVSPLNDGSARIIFGPSDYTDVNFEFGPSLIFVEGIRFSGITQPYFFNAASDATQIGAGGIVYDPASPLFSTIYDAVDLEANQTWDIRSGVLKINGDISGSIFINDVETFYGITKTGAGTLVLNSPFSGLWEGDLTIKDGALAVRPYGEPGQNSPLGSGTVTFDSTAGGAPTLMATTDFIYGPYQGEYYNDNDDSVVLMNEFNLKGTFATRNDNELILMGPVNLQSNVTLNNRGENLVLGGAIADGGNNFKLTIDSLGAVILDPFETSNTYGGGTHVEKGILVFANDGAAPQTGQITGTSDAYVGYGSVTNVTESFLDKFDRANFFGTVGFDTDAFSPIQISNGIDLTGFAASARLGSASKAILTGTITPQSTGSDYRFGGGGGFLQVDSQLTGSRGITADSPAALPLTLRLTNTDNNVSGPVIAKNSAVVFGVDAETENLQLETGGYIGTEGFANQEGLFTPQGFVNKFASGTASGVIGFDTAPSLEFGGSRNIATGLDFSAFTGNVFLGTTTRGGIGDGVLGGLIVSGPLNFGSNPYRFAGYKGGFLRVESPLTGANGVIIGDATSPGTFGDFVGEEYSMVGLFGDNGAMTGDVVLNGGALFVGSSTALGQGKLVVNGMSLPSEWQDEYGSAPSPALAADFDVEVGNDIVLNTQLNILEDSSASLSGIVSGSGSLYVEELSSLTLSNGGNTFSGGIYVSRQGQLEVDSDTATGTGKLGFGYSNGQAYFNTANPVIYGLESDNYGAYVDLEAPNAILEIRQNFDSTFRGYLRADRHNYELNIDESGTILKTGTGTLRLDDAALYSYGRMDTDGDDVSLEVRQGTVVLANDTYVEGGAVKLTGGTLTLDNSDLSVPLIIKSGTLAGNNGYLSNSVSIGSNATVSPGLATNPTGYLDFTHLELQSGGTYRWQIRSTLDPEGHDMLFVYGASTLVIESTPENPFKIIVEPLSLANTTGTVSDFDPSLAYSWTIIESEFTEGFDPANFLLDTSLFAAHNSLDYGHGDGFFTLTVDGHDVILNFTPVPEPSTYALLGLGLGIVAFSAWRRRRAA